MAVTISTSPQYPTTKTATRVSFTLTGGGNYVRVWCTDAPLGSKLKGQLTDAGQGRIFAYEGGAAEVWEFRPDVAGAYVFAAQEYTRGATAYGGGYKGDPNGYPSETKVGSESTVTVRIGQRLEMPAGVQPDRSMLVLWVWDTTIRPTLGHVHGEVTPALVNPQTERARTAAASVSLTTLHNVAATTALGTLSTVANNIIDKFNAHLTQASVHSANDTDNAISASFRSPSTEAALKLSVAEILNKLGRHMRNDDGGGTGSASYHTSGASDWGNALIASAPGDMAGVLIAIADAWRAYEAHRALGSPIHSTADTTNTLTALPALLDVHRAYLALTQPAAPSAPPTANAGAVTLIHGAGMKESS